MSVIMTMKLQGDPTKMEQVAKDDADRLARLIAASKEHGVIAHRFYGSDDGQIMVIDEWPDAESFQAFFDASEAEIGPVMEAAGVTSEPEITFWRKLETGDEIGWGA
jgi:heme-degrading monooxygenase HmoA